MKNGYYFRHDYGARNDKKLIKLSMKYPNCSGYGIYFSIIEMLYEEGGYLLRNEYERISFELRTDYETIKNVIESYELFEFDDTKFWSNSALERLNERNIKSEKAKESVSNRWGKYERNTNVLQSNTKRNTNIVENSIVKNNKREFDFSFVENDYKQAFETWIEYKKERKQPYKTQKSIIAAYEKLKQLSNFNPEIAIEIVNNSMANNWAGLFEIKKLQQNNTKKPLFEQYLESKKLKK